MKHTILACFLFASLVSFATADSVNVATKARPQHQVFANTTFFLKQLINLSNQTIAISPYIVGYKCFFNKSHGLRLAVGGSFSKKTEFPDTVVVRITKNNALDYRVGYEFRHLFGKKWYLQTGVDLVGRYGLSSTKANTTFDIVSTGNTSNSIGGGPFLGIQFNVTPRIALFTETAFYYSYAWNKRKVQSASFPQQNVDRKTDTEYKGEFILPTSLYFVFIF
ncbi:MAG TPA: hypothetical protein VK154_15755 [Chitinophagales bacterium]|nr:hypothetical protein [Chitinophagales bacterium]